MMGHESCPGRRGSFRPNRGCGCASSIADGADALKAKCGSQVRSTLPAGADDQLEISGPELSELANKPVRIDGDRDIQVPLGDASCVGLTAQQTEKSSTSLSKYIRDPQIVVASPKCAVSRSLS